IRKSPLSGLASAAGSDAIPHQSTPGSQMIDAAIVGLGRWGKNFVQSIQGRSSRIRFARGVDAAPDKVREFATTHGFHLCADLADVLADPAIRAVVLATPHSLH